MKIKTPCIQKFLLLGSLLLLAGAISAQAAAYTWNLAAGTAAWDLSGDWTTTGFPNAAGDVANITKTLTGGMNITLGQGVTVGAITMSSSASQVYTLGVNGGSVITLNNNGAGATIVMGIVGNGNANTLAAPVVIADAGGLTITANAGQSRAQLISGGVTGTGNLTINDNRTGGTSTTVSITTGAINNTGTLTVSSPTFTSAKATVFSSAIGANVTTFTKLGAGTLTISGANAYTGATTITAGTLTLGGANEIPSISSVSVTGTLNLNGESDNIDGLSGAGIVDATIAGTITLGIGNNNSGGTFSGVIQNTLGTLSLTKSGSGTEVLSGLNTYAGTTAINGGILGVSSTETAGTSGPLGKPTTAANSIVFGGGKLQYSAANTFDYSSRFSTAASQPISIDVNGQTVSFATALISSGGSLTLSDTAGSGKLTLAATPTYSGATTINGGTLALSSGALAIGSSVSIGAGGTFDVSALASPYNFGSSATLTATGTGTSGTTEANIVAASGGTFSLGTQPVNLTWGGSSSGGGTTPCLNISQGTLAFNGNAITVSGPAGGLGAGTYTLVSVSGSGALSGAAPVVTVTGADLAAGCVVTGTTLNSSSLTITIAPSGAVGTWNGAASGNWSVAGNWTGTGALPPQAAGDAAIFGTGASPVIFDAGATGYSVGTITFNTATAFTISGSPALTLDNKGNGALISAISAAGSPAVISTPLSLNDNATITLSSGTTLNLSGVVSSISPTKTLTVNGAGTTILGNVNIYGPSASTVGTTLSGGGILQVGNSSALSTGDLSVSGSGTLQSGLAGLSIANKIIIGASQTATMDNNGYALTLGGIISGSGALSSTGSGSLVLNSANTYSGGTIINAGTISISADGALAGNSSYLGVVPASATVNNVILNGGDLQAGASLTLNANRGIGIGATSGGTPATALIDAASGQTFTVNGVIKSAGNTGANNLTVNSILSTPGTVVLGGANTYNGNTTITAGTLQLGVANAIPGASVSTVTVSGTLDLNGKNDTIDGLTGSGTVTDSGAAATLTTGNENSGGTFSGNFGNGTAISLTQAGNGTLTLGNANYTGSTAVTSSGTLTINGGSFGSSSSTINVALNNGGTATLNYSGNGTVAASTVGVGNVNAGASGTSMTLSGGVSANFSALNLGAAGNYFGNFTIDTTGTVGLGAVTDYKDQNANGPAGTAAGLVISAGTVTASSLIVQDTGSSGAATVNMRGGSLTIGNSSSSGAFEMGNGASTRGGWLEMTGGTLTYLGSDGLLMGNVAVTASGATISGGTASLTGVTLNPFGGTASSLTVSNGATLYLGSGGLVINQPSATVLATLGNGGATVGALADWSSVAPITLAGSVGSTIFQAADASSTAHNISLGGILSGTGALTKTGNGTLKLGGDNSYGGTTTVSAGTLQVNGNDSSAAGAVTVQNSGTTLGGTGTVGGAATFQANTRLVPGDGVTASVPLSFAGTLTLDAAATSVFAVNNAAGGAVNKVAVTGALTPAGSVIHIVNSGTPLFPGTYPLFTCSGGVSGPTFYATPVFDAGTAVTGGSIVDNGSGQVSLVVTNVPPVIQNPALDVNGHPAFSGSGIPNYTYGVESATSLTGPWINAVPGTVTTDGAGSWSFTDASQTNPETIFYRLYWPYSAGSPPQ